MKFTEIFDTIQGEGPLQGRPCLFIRLAGCNLNCSWCDTKYAQDHVEAAVIGPQELAHVINERMKTHDVYTKPVVFTGGEPMLQQVGILETCKQYSNMTAMKPRTWFETNGTVRPHEELDEFCEPMYVVSPKVEALNATILAKFPPKRTFLKFVMQWNEEKSEWNWSIADMDEICRSILGAVDRDRIYLMPQAKTKEELIERGPRVWKLCTDHGFAFSARLHVIFYSNQRGV